MQLKVRKKQNNSKDCIVCGYHNPLSLACRFYETEGEILVGICTGKNEHQSYPGRMHGGMITALLDEAIGRAVQMKDPNMWAVTGELTIKYRKPVPLDEEMKTFCKVVKDTSRIFVGKGFIENEQGDILAEATATYVKLPLDKIMKQSPDDALDYVPWPNDVVETPAYVEMKNETFFQER